VKENQQQFSIKVWAGIVGDCLVRPHVLPHRLRGNNHRDFLLHELPKLLEDEPLAVRAQMQYVHDGAPTYFSRDMLDVLNNTYHDQWIVTRGPTAWPPHSPDLNPLDFYLWVHLEALLYAALIDNEEALHHRIVAACQALRNYPGVFERMRLSKMRRVDACIGSHGVHFDHVL
jgi:hypothetical protein